MVKKSLVPVLICMLSMVFIFGACSSGGSGNNGGGFFQNTVDGKQLDIQPASNFDNLALDKNNVVHLVSGETFSIESFFWVQDPNDKTSYGGDNTDPALAGTLWNITGKLGYLVTEGKTTATGANTSLTITGAAGTTGTISAEVGGLKCTYPIKIVASQKDLPAGN